MHKHILLPTDGSELSEQAVNYGVDLAKGVNAKVTGITVSTPFHIYAVEPGAVTDDLESYTARMSTVAAGWLAYVKDVAAAAGVSCEVVHAQHEHPYRAIIDTATNRGCDLIVMASHGRRGISAIVLGSETVKVLTHSTIPVLVYRGPRTKLPPYFAASLGASIFSRCRGKKFYTRSSPHSSNAAKYRPVRPETNMQQLTDVRLVRVSCRAPPVLTLLLELRESRDS